MRLLIDTHIFIWLLVDGKKISKSSAKIIEQAEEVYVSLASLWELAIKYSTGKTNYSPEMLDVGVSKLNLNTLDIKASHIHNVTDIVLKHSDPFDKMLVSQAEVEGMYLLTSDRLLIESSYRVLAN